MKVYLVDDSAIVRERIVSMLSDFEEIEIIGQAQDGLEATVSIRRLKPDVVILDIHLPGSSGIEVLEAIKKDKPAPVVIMFTNYPYPQYRKRCMDLGADFFFDKSTEYEKITEVFKRLLYDNSQNPDPNIEGEL